MRQSNWIIGASGLRWCYVLKRNPSFGNFERKMAETAGKVMRIFSVRHISSFVLFRMPCAACL